MRLRAETRGAVSLAGRERRTVPRTVGCAATADRAAETDAQALASKRAIRT